MLKKVHSNILVHLPNSRSWNSPAKELIGLWRQVDSVGLKNICYCMMCVYFSEGCDSAFMGAYGHYFRIMGEEEVSSWV